MNGSEREQTGVNRSGLEKIGAKWRRMEKNGEEWSERELRCVAVALRWNFMKPLVLRCFVAKPLRNLLRNSKTHRYTHRKTTYVR